VKKVSPLGKRVLVRRIDTTTESEGGIVIPDQAQEKPLEADVVAVGPKVDEVSVGDQVMFSKYAGTEVLLDGDPLLLLDQDDIQARLE